eukprot:5623127-Prymnesium_polylepis.1
MAEGGAHTARALAVAYGAPRPVPSIHVARRAVRACVATLVRVSACRPRGAGRASKAVFIYSDATRSCGASGTRYVTMKGLTGSRRVPSG